MEGKGNPQEHTEPALPLTNGEGHDPIVGGETGQPNRRRPLQLTGLRSIPAHSGCSTRWNDAGLQPRHQERPQTPACGGGAGELRSDRWGAPDWIAHAEATVVVDDDHDVDYYIGERLKLEGEMENMGVYTKERKGVTAEVHRQKDKERQKRM